MFLTGLMFAAAAAAPLSAQVDISPAVVAVAGKYGDRFGPEAERELEKLQAGGDRTAAALLGEILSFPDRVGGPDFARSCGFSEAAGRHGSALHNLATCYFAGRGRPRDLRRARELYAQAAEMGFAKAACAYGNMLMEGQGGATDVARGLDLCRQAADAGEPDAQTDYGGYLLVGRGLPRDAVKARHYLSLAAARKQANAAFLLAQIYWNGDGVGTDRAKAAENWEIAFEGGRTDAAFLIGVEAASRIMAAVEAVRPVPSDALADAEKWLKLAQDKARDPAERQKANELWQGISAIAEAARAAQGKR